MKKESVQFMGEDKAKWLGKASVLYGQMSCQATLYYF